MKSFFDLLKTDRKFLLYFAFFIFFVVWVYWKGWELAAGLIVLFMAVVVGINLWKTRK